MSVMQKDVARMDDSMPMEWDPFTDPSEGAPFFPGAGRAEIVEQLQHLLRYGPGLVVLAGASGVGKETLVNHLLDQLDPDLFDVADLQANVMLSFQQLLTSLEEPWRSLHPITLENYLELVPALASAADEESKTLLCVVRDAEQLDGESIADLKALLGVAVGLPVKFLLVVGAAEIEQAPHIRGLVEALPESHVLYMDPLTPEQTAEYLRFRLQSAGLGNATFNASQLDSIVRTSAGNMVRINGAARELLLDAMPAQPVAHRPVAPRSELPWLHIGALVVLVVVVAGLALLGEDEPAATDAAATAPGNRIVLENAAQPVAESAPTEDRFAEVGRVAEQSSPQPQESTEPMVMDASGAPAAPVVEPAQSPAQSTEQMPAATVHPATPTEPVTSSTMNLPAQPVTEAVAPTVQPGVAEPKPAAETPAPVKPVVVEKAPAATAPVGDARTRWLQGLPFSHYVIQLLGASEESTVKRFLVQYPSLKQVTYYRTQRQGKSWYVVVQGDYPDYESAKAGIKRLPAAIQQQTPWVRKVDAVQQELKTR